MPTIRIDPPNASLYEGNSGVGKATFTVTLSTASDSIVAVDYATRDSSAKSGSDYVGTSGTLSFEPGELTKTIDVLISGDEVYEPNEIFRLSLSNPSNADLDLSGSVIKGYEALFTITNDDLSQRPTIRIDPPNASLYEGNSGVGKATFTVTLSTASDSIVAVDYATRDSSAKSGSDYVGTSGTLSFEPGELTKTIDVLISGDEVYEPNEIFRLSLSNPSNADLDLSGSVIKGYEALFTITNDDLSQRPTYSINSSADSYDEGQSALFSLVTANLAAGTFVAYTLSGISESDLESGSLTGTAVVGESGTTVISIPLAADTLTEGAETLTITLDDSSSTTASLVVNDTSKNPVIMTTTHLTSILVDEGVLGALPVILEGLTENIEETDGVTTNHVFSFNGSDYDYDDISPFIMIVLRDNEFTDDFRNELADFAPEYKNLTYQEAVAAVGLVGISDAIITVAGADGNYIG